MCGLRLADALTDGPLYEPSSAGFQVTDLSPFKFAFEPPDASTRIEAVDEVLLLDRELLLWTRACLKKLGSLVILKERLVTVELHATVTCL